MQEREVSIILVRGGIYSTVQTYYYEERNVHSAKA